MIIGSIKIKLEGISESFKCHWLTSFINPVHKVHLKLVFLQWNSLSHGLWTFILLVFFRELVPLQLIPLQICNLSLEGVDIGATSILCGGGNASAVDNINTAVFSLRLFQLHHQ